eukprot:6468300-Amphidinium_carterae.1
MSRRSRHIILSCRERHIIELPCHICVAVTVGIWSTPLLDHYSSRPDSDGSGDILDVLCGAAASSKRETPPEADTSSERSPKAQKVQAVDEELSSVTWAKRLKAAFSEHFQRRGTQLRPLNCASSCSGLASDTIALEDRRVSQTGNKAQHF